VKCPDFTIYDMIARNAGLYPEKNALVYGDKRISFRDYKKLCDQCAAGLIKEGINIGDRIAVLSGNSDDFLILCGAAAKIGAVVVPVNTRLGEAEVEYILKDSTPKYLFSSKEYRESARKASISAGSVRKHYVFKTDTKESDFIPFETLFLDAKSKQADTVSDSYAYMIIHTAAMGGKPRGCLLSQANMLSICLQMAQLFKLSNRDCHICNLPLFHIGGFSMTLAVMHQGGKNLIMDRFDPLAVLKLTEKEQGTFFGTFPPMLATILDAQDKQFFDTSSLRGVGGMDAPETIQRFLKKNPQAVFYSVYGQTECMPVSGCDITEKPGSIGLPAIMTRVAIFDDMDREVSNGVQGEICVRSPAVFLGYWNLEADTAHTFRNGWHHTGDLGRIDKEGFIWYGGRKPEKELIKPGGENVYPLEVEKVILDQGDVEMVSVIGVPDVQWGEAIKAVCVLKPGRSLEPQALIDFVASKIAHYKKPRYVVFVNSLPKTKEGKIDRDQVKKTHGGKY
jgi:acyl-CoA synthetase (AMP-forming)/AMP-acid ligase II